MEEFLERLEQGSDINVVIDGPGSEFFDRVAGLIEKYAYANDLFNLTKTLRLATYPNTPEFERLNAWPDTIVGLSRCAADSNPL